MQNKLDVEVQHDKSNSECYLVTNVQVQILLSLWTMKKMVN